MNLVHRVPTAWRLELLGVADLDVRCVDDVQRREVQVTRHPDRHRSEPAFFLLAERQLLLVAQVAVP